jgi:hypothetical protein
MVMRGGGVRVGAICCLGLLVAGCAARPADDRAATSSAVSESPIAGRPTQPPCVAPSAAGIRDEVAGADLVLTGHVGAAPASSTEPNGQVFDTFTVAVSRVVAKAPGITVGSDVNVVEAGGGPRHVLSQGDYRLFLTRAVDGSSFFATNGLPGIFSIGPDGQSLTRICANVEDPASPSAVPASSMPVLDKVLSWIPGTLPGSHG